ncbi:MAG TPA: NAD-dependent epimerase/dehydratase family protein, partial [Ktedonobacterales bacterium]|nr:NAD-dependent epimerase/dehydratase family protein [Ktedonobacterales bacterium]
MRCLVTGVAGFVGSHLAERLIADGHDVLGVDCFLDYYPRALKEANIAALRRSPRFQFIEADLNANPLDELLYDMEWVFHQAAQAGVRASWGTSFDIYTASNISATQRLLEAALTAPKLARIVYASSSSVYGNADVLPVTEQTLTRPVSPYGVSKLAGEHLCALYWHSYRVPTVALRYFTVYGPRQRPDMAFHRFGKAILTSEPITVYGDAAQTRDFTYISDVVEANIRAAQAPDVEGMAFNIAGGSRVVLREVIETLATLAGREAQIEYQETARGDVRDTSADIALAQRLLGYAPQVSLREGLEQ